MCGWSGSYVGTYFYLGIYGMYTTWAMHRAVRNSSLHINRGVVTTQHSISMLSSTKVSFRYLILYSLNRLASCRAMFFDHQDGFPTSMSWCASTGIITNTWGRLFMTAITTTTAIPCDKEEYMNLLSQVFVYSLKQSKLYGVDNVCQSATNDALRH